MGTTHGGAFGRVRTISSGGGDNEVQLRDAPGLSTRGVVAGHQTGRRVGFLRLLRRRRDLAQGPVAALRGRGPGHDEHPLRTEPLRGGPARAHAHRPGRGDARRAHERPRRSGPRIRQLRPAGAVQDRLGAHQAAVPGQGGRPGHPDVARRRGHHLRRRVLQLRRTLHLRAAGPGAVARQDRVHARPEVVRGRRRVLRRLPPRAQLHPRGLRVRVRALQRRRRAGREEPRRPRLRGLGGDRDRAGLGGGEAGRPLDGRDLRLVHAA